MVHGSLISRTIPTALVEGNCHYQRSNRKVSQMNTTVRMNVAAELVVKLPDGSSLPAEEHHLIDALRRQGYVILKFRPGNSVESYGPDWLTDAVEKHRYGTGQ